MPSAGTSRLPYQLNGLADFLARSILCFMNLAIVGKQLFFEIGSLSSEQSLLIPYREKWLLAWWLMLDIYKILIAHEAI